MILGIDEVGRGPWAGPLVVGAVVLGQAAIEGLTDSKKLTKKRRTMLDDSIRQQAAGYGLGWVSATEIDKIGLGPSLVLATKRAVAQITVPYHEIILDGRTNFLRDTTKGPYVTTLKQADLLIPSVSAASIIAKVARDQYMARQDEVYPGYGFAQHVGYGTAAHRAAIDQLGVTPLHRLSFAPLAKYRPVQPPVAQSQRATVTTRQLGDAGEAVAANYLQQQGHTILNRNWRTRYCEIDIVSRQGDVVYFTEVKHRRNSVAGDGLAAITPRKLQQMHFAAEAYAQRHGLTMVNLQLQVIATTGQPPQVSQFVVVD